MSFSIAMRIQKFLAACGAGSRRAVERLITEGRVRVNGQPATVGHDIDPERDRLEVDGRLIVPPAKVVILMMHKPAGYVTTVDDPQGRPTVMQLLPPGLPRVYPVGRLDRDSEGLLLFTNDGELTHRMLHPSFGVWKRYIALVAQPLSRTTLETLCRGVSLEDGKTSPCRAWCHPTKAGPGEGRGRPQKTEAAWEVVIEIKEGRKRQVRRMLGVLGHPALHLRRVAFGPLQLGNLAMGSTRPLQAEEERRLREALADQDRSTPSPPQGMRRGKANH